MQARDLGPFVCTGLLAAAGALAAAAHAAAPFKTGQDETAPRTEADRRILAAAGAIEEEVALLRERPFRKEVRKEVYSREQLAGFMAAQLADPVVQRQLGDQETFLRAIGFLPVATSLGDLYRDMLTSQVAGFYDPDDGTLRCISTDIAFVQRLTLVHEIYHALQDQYAPLEPYMDGPAPGAGDGAARAAGDDDPRPGSDPAARSDAMRARQAVVEGDAQFFTMRRYAPLHREEINADLKGQSPGELLGFGLGQALAQAAIPPFFVEELSWPYLTGAQFVEALYDAGGWAAVDRAFAEPPLSTEQILHPRKYLEGGDPPLRVVAPTPAFAAGWTEVMRDTLGEAAVAALIRHLGHDPVHATRGSTGWGGDEALVLRAAAGDERDDVLVWRLRFDSDRDAEQFHAAWRRVLTRQYVAADEEGAPAPVLIERAPLASAFAAIAGTESRVPDHWAGAPLPPDAGACVAMRGAEAPSWLLLRGAEALLVRGRALLKLGPADLEGLAGELGR